jgi:hypothetical protein
MAADSSSDVAAPPTSIAARRHGWTDDRLVTGDDAALGGGNLGTTPNNGDNVPIPHHHPIITSHASHTYNNTIDPPSTINVAPALPVPSMITTTMARVVPVTIPPHSPSANYQVHTRMNDNHHNTSTPSHYHTNNDNNSGVPVTDPHHDDDDTALEIAPPAAPAPPPVTVKPMPHGYVAPSPFMRIPTVRPWLLIHLILAIIR